MWKFTGLLIKYRINLNATRSLHTAIPSSPVYKDLDKKKLPKPTVIDESTINHLERASLVDFANKRGIQRLEEAIQLADQLSVVDTTDVEPMYSVLDYKTLYLREDTVTDGVCRKDVMANAAVTEEEYFVAPPGNIPLAPREKSYQDS